jgi:hypothetical protein
MQSDNDIQIPPTPSRTDNAPLQNSQQQGQSTTVQLPSKVIIEGPQGLHNNQILLGAGISLVLAILFWFIGRMLADTLVKQFAEVGAAKRAGRTLFIFLTVTAIFATFGFIGDLWTAIRFIVPGAGLSFITFVVFLFMLLGAFKSRRG